MRGRVRHIVTIPVGAEQQEASRTDNQLARVASGEDGIPRRAGSLAADDQFPTGPYGYVNGNRCNLDVFERKSEGVIAFADANVERAEVEYVDGFTVGVSKLAIFTTPERVGLPLVGAAGQNLLDFSLHGNGRRLSVAQDVCQLRAKRQADSAREPTILHLRHQFTGSKSYCFGYCWKTTKPTTTTNHSTSSTNSMTTTS